MREEGGKGVDVKDDAQREIEPRSVGPGRVGGPPGDATTPGDTTAGDLVTTGDPTTAPDTTSADTANG